MNQEISEALAAVTPSRPSLIPDGKILVGVKLDVGDWPHKGPFVGFNDEWKANGVAVAMRGGEVVAANLLYGHTVEGEAVVKPAFERVCAKCGHHIRQPEAVFAAKDNFKAKGGGRHDLDGVDGDVILAKYGKCPMCRAEASGGKVWMRPADEAERRARAENRTVSERDDIEVAEICAAKDAVLDLLSKRQNPVCPLLVPRTFGIVVGGKPADLDPNWDWVNQSFAGSGNAAVPFDRDLWSKTRGRCYDGGRMLINPGIWVGWVDDPFATGLFFRKTPNPSAGRARNFVFDPSGMHVSYDA